MTVCTSTGRECNDLRFSILVGRCINPNVPGAIPNWKGAPSFRVLKPTPDEDLFPAPPCSSTTINKQKLYKVATKMQESRICNCIIVEMTSNSLSLKT